MPHATDTAPRAGEHVDGYEVPVLDEHAVRIAAGILLAIGITALTITLASDSIRPLQMFEPSQVWCRILLS
ncbi:hypothetical protein [Microbacterium sp. KRD172]|uniref:hypothetical protein n=1 Tax=Microbacterium sp. KRD172 TaxID=2729727 RepID=UPI0019D0B062|nr:hypothetical protein [Microbacterium sp. KRD172]